MLPRSSDLLFSTDMYDNLSVKAHERMRRGEGDKLQITKRTLKPKDWKAFLSNSDNKDQLATILYDVWTDDGMIERLGNREIVLINQGKAFDIQVTDGNVKVTEIKNLFSTQEETDTRVVLYCMHAASIGYKYVRVRTPDSDIFFILLNQT